MNTEKIKIEFCEVRCTKDGYKEGYMKEFCHYAPDSAYINKVEDVMKAVRDKMCILDDVEVYIEESECLEDGYYDVSWLSGSHEIGRNPSEYQLERWKAGKCVLWAFDVLIRLTKVTETPLEGLTFTD